MGNSGTSPTFSFMRAQVESFLVAGRSWSSLDASHAPRTDDPMEVDAIWHAGGKGKGKGKEKGKGKGKGKGKEKKGGKREDGKGDKQGEDASKKFDGYCGYCGAWGHRQRDCRKKQRAEGSISQVGEPHAEPDSGTSQNADSSSAHGSGGHAMAVLPADGWVMVVGQVKPVVQEGLRHDLLVDSGASEHVCDLSHFDDVPLEKGQEMRLRYTSGTTGFP